MAIKSIMQSGAEKLVCGTVDSLETPTESRQTRNPNRTLEYNIKTEFRDYVAEA